MKSDRRGFLGSLTAGAVLAALPATPEPLSALELNFASSAEWDLSWTRRVKGKYRAILDVADTDSAYGVWRANMYLQQYREVLGAGADDVTAVLVLRHHGIALAMQQAFWDTYGVAKVREVTHPITQQGTDHNPALLSSARGEVPAQYDAMALDRFQARGGIVLACSVALEFEMVPLVAKRDGVDADAARRTAVSGLLPGVILQPSGVFAALHAQDVGCKYLRAS